MTIHRQLLRVFFSTTNKSLRIRRSYVTFAKILPSDVLIEEERTPGYRPEFYYPANPGQILNQRYKILTKIGWGTASTIWLAEDLEETKEPALHYVALKIPTSNPDYADVVRHEADINSRLTKDTTCVGFAFVRAAIDEFITIGPSGQDHLCLLFESMREPLNQFQQRLPNARIPPLLLKVYIDLLLRGLDYLHSECHHIHTDLKADNILMSFEDQSVLDDYVNAQIGHPMARKVSGDRNVYLSHNDFGALHSYWVLPKIVDFGLAQHQENNIPFRHPIQPAMYHAPEVLLGVSWSYSVDIWNFEVLLFELLEDKALFSHLRLPNGVYSPRAQLAEMISLLGPPPTKLLNQANKWHDIPWDRSFPSLVSEGLWCKTAREYYVGPFFGSKGCFMHPEAIPARVQLGDCVMSMEGEEKELFLAFVMRMLQWVPEDRSTAKELLEDPWLQTGLVD